MTDDGNSDAESTRRTYVKYAGTLVASGLLAGCSSQSDALATAEPTATDTVAATATDTTQGPPVQVRAHPELGDILVDAEGMTLYMYDADTQGAGSSTCYDGCAAAWPPLTGDGGTAVGDGVAAELTTFERSTEATQVAANGWPLYYWVDDSEPGDATGQGVNDVWWVLTPDGTPVRSD